MDDTERQIRMSKLVYTQHNVSQLKMGILALLDMFSEVMGMTETHIDAKEMAMRLDNVEYKVWNNIREKYILDEYYEYTNGSFTPGELKDPAKLMFDLVKALDGLKIALQKKMEEVVYRENELKMKIRSLEETLEQQVSQNTKLALDHNVGIAEQNIQKADRQRYEKLLQEKNEQIAQLQRESTVQLWTKEKDKILHEAKLREADLEGQVLTLKTEKLDMKLNMQKKINELEDANRMAKMKSEMRIGPSRVEKNSTEKELNNKVYYMERDIVKIGSEMTNQQKYFVGIAGGLVKDHRRNYDKLMANEKNVLNKGTVKDIEKLQKTLDQLHIAVKEGRLNEFRAGLSDDYIALDVDIKKPPVKMFSKLYIENIKQTDFKPVKGGKSTGDKGEDSDSSSSDDDDVDGDKADKPQENPELVTKMGRVNMINVMKNFPTMSEAFVRDQFEQFKKYDADGSGKLDLTELMAAMTTTVGQQFTASQIKAAMYEVDKDHSNSIDFYEYLLISYKILQKNGRSDVFRSDLAKTGGKAVTKTCVIQ